MGDRENQSYNIYLLRHGKTLGPAALNGKTNVEVAEETQQAIIETLYQDGITFSHVVSSPLIRCCDLANKLVEQDQSLTLKIESKFQELDFGDFDGRTFDELQPHWEQLESFWRDPASHTLPNAESLQACYSRVSEGWSNLIEQSTHDTLVICHGGTIRLILAKLLGIDWKNPNWYSTLNIANQSVTQIKILKQYQNKPHIQMIGKPL
ncbi:histidine phosphatase family protein [Vibrio sp. ZSDE26]|uniref:Histidine phosphatase family protein n=1 Tax=Vibrio amylolyticus TaxID=2847292 RepID=A0A9X1XLH5_9VIBR|nr:histidine phosphatase family protein [Vibrio amylolyticus]MCK6264931.1 histidine phosphatase family protein [Vibrio amylolyticus]